MLNKITEEQFKYVPINILYFPFKLNKMILKIIIVPPIKVPMFGISFSRINPSKLESSGVINIKLVTSLVFSARDRAVPQRKYATALGIVPRYITDKICSGLEVSICVTPSGKKTASNMVPQTILYVTISSDVYPMEESFLFKIL